MFGDGCCRPSQAASEKNAILREFDVDPESVAWQVNDVDYYRRGRKQAIAGWAKTFTDSLCEKLKLARESGLITMAVTDLGPTRAFWPVSTHGGNVLTGNQWFDVHFERPAGKHKKLSASIAAEHARLKRLVCPATNGAATFTVVFAFVPHNLLASDKASNSKSSEYFGHLFGPSPGTSLSLVPNRVVCLMFKKRPHGSQLENLARHASDRKGFIKTSNENLETFAKRALLHIFKMYLPTSPYWRQARAVDESVSVPLRGLPLMNA